MGVISPPPSPLPNPGDLWYYLETFRVVTTGRESWVVTTLGVLWVVLRKVEAKLLGSKKELGSTVRAAKPPGSRRQPQNGNVLGQATEILWVVWTNRIQHGQLCFAICFGAHNKVLYEHGGKRETIASPVQSGSALGTFRARSFSFIPLVQGNSLVMSEGKGRIQKVGVFISIGMSGRRPNIWFWIVLPGTLEMWANSFSHVVGYRRNCSYKL